MNGTPVRSDGRPVVIPACAVGMPAPAMSALTAFEESEVPLKQTACAAGEEHDDWTGTGWTRGCWNVNWPSRM